LGAASAAFVLAFASKEIPGLRDRCPWRDDPYDAVLSFGLLLLPPLIGIGLIRWQRHRGGDMPPYAREQIRRTLAAALIVASACAFAALIATALASPSVDAANAGVFAVTAAFACARAGVSLLRAWQVDRAPFDRADATDLVDDVAFLAPGRIGPLAERLADARHGPRRKPLTWALAATVAAGAGFDAWHAVREGPWADASAAFAFGVLGAATAVIVLALSSWLMVLRRSG